MDRVTVALSILFTAFCCAAGLWDLFLMAFAGDQRSVSTVIRTTELRYPMAVAIAGFALAHFWYRR
jgi:hypothetical protein